MDKVKVLPYLVASRVLKHTQVVGNNRISASKKRKAMQQLIKQRLEQQLDKAAQKGMSADLRLYALAARKEFYTQKYGNLKYASNGLTILV